MKKVGLNMDITRQSACLVVNPITFNRYDFLFNITMASQASDSMMVLTLMGWFVSDAGLWLGPPWLNLSFSFAQAICES